MHRKELRQTALEREKVTIDWLSVPEHDLHGGAARATELLSWLRAYPRCHTVQVRLAASRNSASTRHLQRTLIGLGCTVTLHAAL